MKTKLTKICKREGCTNEFKLYKSTDKYCSFECAKLCQKAKAKSRQIIKPVSHKRQKDSYTYAKKRKIFLALPENEFCFVYNCKNLATTIEHTRGRIGKNYLDISTWKPCCLFHNLEFETNTKLSNKYQESKFHKGKKIIKHNP